MPKSKLRVYLLSGHTEAKEANHTRGLLSRYDLMQWWGWKPWGDSKHGHRLTKKALDKPTRQSSLWELICVVWYLAVAKKHTLPGNPIFGPVRSFCSPLETRPGKLFWRFADRLTRRAGNLATEPWLSASSHGLVPTEPGASRVAMERRSPLRQISVHGWPQ